MKIGGEMTWKRKCTLVTKKFEIFCMLTEILNESKQFQLKSVSKKLSQLYNIE